MASIAHEFFLALMSTLSVKAEEGPTQGGYDRAPRLESTNYPRWAPCQNVIVLKESEQGR